jgi:GR25 family glycosyltransferase involved in LPS biosynthesis
MRINDYFSKVILINLDRRKDRLEKISTQLDNLGITFERFSAIDGKELGINPIAAGTMSHQKVLEANPESRILVLEDDAEFVDGFNEKFAEAIQHLPSDTDIFYLGALLPKHTGKVENIGNKYWFKQIMSTGSHAYSIHPARVKYFAEKLKGYEWYIDIGLREFAKEYKAVIAQPNLVIQYPSYSDLRLKEVSDF